MAIDKYSKLRTTTHKVIHKPFSEQLRELYEL